MLWHATTSHCIASPIRPLPHPHAIITLCINVSRCACHFLLLIKMRERKKRRQSRGRCHRPFASMSCASMARVFINISGPFTVGFVSLLSFLLLLLAAFAFYFILFFNTLTPSLLIFFMCILRGVNCTCHQFQLRFFSWHFCPLLFYFSLLFLCAALLLVRRICLLIHYAPAGRGLTSSCCSCLTLVIHSVCMSVCMYMYTLNFLFLCLG